MGGSPGMAIPNSAVYSEGMKKRPFLIATFVLVSTLILRCWAVNEPVLVKHPNVLFISLDDMNDWIGPLAGNAQAITPSLDQFARQSVTFSRNYTPSPGCNPSRSATLTGLHTFSSGMYSNYQDWRKVPALQEVQTIGQHFRNSGYYTAGAGKIFHYNQVDKLGWDDYYPGIENPMPEDNFPEVRPASMTPFKYMYDMFDWGPLEIADEETGDFETVEYISQQLGRKHDKPFFLAAGIYRPHLPWFVPQKYFDKFPIEHIRKPVLLEDDIADLGPVAKEIITRGGNYHTHVVQAGQWEKAVQGYLASVAFADGMVGRLLKALENSGYADNTIVVIWSDHGWQLGEKEHWRKFALWENVIRTVLMMKVPAGLEKMPAGSINGGVTKNLTSLLDIYPTLVELCNLPERDDFDGISLKSILANPEMEVPRAIISSYDYGSYSIRYENWHYIRYIDASEELYNLADDPEEWHNLAADKNMTDIKSLLASYIPRDQIDLPQESLLELMEHHVPPFRSEAYFFSEERKSWMKRFE
jgi:arylsulfatase A-like enzyme